MTHELILTSVAQGLDTKEHGFCTVAVDAAISPHVVESLLELSGCWHIDSESGQNAISYSHFILPSGVEHVLSRTAESGVDYRQQSNVFAHHIVLESVEIVPESPAWLLALPDFHLSEWNEPPLRFVKGRPVPTLTNPPSLTRRQLIARQCRWLDPQKMTLTGCVDTESEEFLSSVQSNNNQIFLAASPTTPCPTWQKLTGDPGWGGTLASTSFTGQSVVLVFNPGQNILPLVVEALALLPLYYAWKTTFCTYYTNLPNTIPCQWIGVIAGSEAAKRFVEDPTYLVLDLTQPMGVASVGKYVDFARYGRENLLPQETDEYVAIYTDTDTKPYGDGDVEASKREMPSNKMPNIFPPMIQLPKRSNLFKTFLYHQSRYQFYFLYGIMFVLVLFLLVLALDQAGNFGIVRLLKNRNQSVLSVLPEEPKLEINPDVETEIVLELEITEPNPPIEAENVWNLFEENRKKQKAPLLQCLENFIAPQYSAINFPSVQNNLIDVPEKKTFEEFSLLQPFGAALELRFIPLFEFPQMKIETRLLTDTLPELIWQVDAIETDFTTPIFRFQLTEAGLEMDWQPEGLSNQHLYDTILASLGFLQLSVVDSPNTARQIQLFTPVKTKPVKVSDLVALAESATAEYVIELPFAEELWQQVFAEMDPPNTVILKVRATPEGNWIQFKPSPVSVFCAELPTTQQVGRQTDNGETVFENIGIQFTAEASLERVVWKGDEHTDRLRSEMAKIKSAKDELEKVIELLRRGAFEDNNIRIREERKEHEVELLNLNLQFKMSENILEKLPVAYKEIGRNEAWQFHYSVSVKMPEGEQELLILTTDQ